MFVAKMDEFREEREAMKYAPLKERLAYFWEYNKIEITFVVVVVCIVGLISNLLSRKEEVLNGIMLNRFWMQEEDLGCDEFLDSYMEYRGYDISDYEINLNSTLSYTVGGEPSVLDVEVNVPQVIAAQATAGVLDYMIADEAVILEFGSFEYFGDLREIFTSDELETYKDILIYSEDNTEIPIAIDVTDSQCLAELYSVQHDTLAIAMFVNAEHIDEFKCFVEYVLKK